MEYVEEALREDVTTPVIISNLSLQELEQKLDQAVLAENYELAAKYVMKFHVKNDNKFPYIYGNFIYSYNIKP